MSPAGRHWRGADRTQKRIKDGRHVVLDFYDLLIEPLMLLIRTDREQQASHVYFSDEVEAQPNVADAGITVHKPTSQYLFL